MKGPRESVGWLFMRVIDTTSFLIFEAFRQGRLRTTVPASKEQQNRTRLEKKISP